MSRIDAESDSGFRFWPVHRKTQPNQGLDLTNPGAAQSVAGAPLCLLSGLAAQAHVGLAENP